LEALVHYLKRIFLELQSGQFSLGNHLTSVADRNCVPVYGENEM